MIWDGPYPIPGPVCGPLALAFVLQRPFPEVLSDMASTRSPLWRGRMTGAQRDAYLREWGFDFTVKHYPRNVVRLGQWVRLMSKPDVAYLVTITGHVLIIWNGCCYDQAGVETIDLYKDRRKFIIAVTHFRSNGHALF